AKHLAGFTRCRTMAIGRDIRHHRAPQLAITLIDVLNGALTVRLAWQVKINVRPLTAFEREEAFKQQIQADGIDDGDFERVTDNAIGSGTAALNQDVVGL